jgi:methionyl-tRNA formyltransferase
VTPRVVFFGNSESVFTNRHFAALVDQPCEVVGVVDVPPAKRTSTNKPATSDEHSFVGWAQRNGVPLFEPASPNTSEFVEQIRSLSPDVFIAVGYTNLLKSELLSVPRILSANFHASLLPAYRGKHPVFWALRNGEKWCGVTVHAMDPGLDTGDILFQVRVRTRRDDSVGSLYDRIIQRSVPLLGRLVRAVADGEIPRRKQSEEGASYFSSVGEEDFRIDWTRDAEQIRRWICATPGECFFDLHGTRVFLCDAERAIVPGDFAPGTIIRLRRDGCVIACGSGALRIRSVRVSGGSPEPAAEVLRTLGLEASQSLFGR